MIDIIVEIAAYKFPRYGRRHCYRGLNKNGIYISYIYIYNGYSWGNGHKKVMFFQQNVPLNGICL